MPIHGLTDRGLAFPEIGSIRKGAKKSQNAPGADLRYFRVEFDAQEQERERVFRQKYGDRPNEINIILPFNDIEKVWDAWYEAYTAGRLVARGNGERIVYQLDADTGEVKVLGGEPITPQPKDGIVGWYVDGHGARQPIKLKPTGRLKVMIPELQSLAYLTVHTTSIHDIINISSQLEGIKTLNGGRIAGIPLVLRRRPKMISTPMANGGRARREKWLLSIEADPQWVRAKLLEMKKAALPGNGLALLPEGEEQGHALPEEVQPAEGVYSDAVWEDEDEEYADAPAEAAPVMVSAAPAAEERREQNGKIERPYPPEVVRGKIRSLATEFERNGEKPSEGQKSVLPRNLEMCFAGMDESETARRSVMQYLTGKTSTKELTDGEVLALRRWLNVRKDSGGEWLPDPMAEAEANLIWRILQGNSAHLETSEAEL